MKTVAEVNQKTEVAKDEPTARPLARMVAREISTEELARISGGWGTGLTNFGGGRGDIDWLK